MNTIKRSSGFTLLELMITVAIIGILAAIAYPSYTAYVTQSKRSDAKAALLQAQLTEEKYRANNTTYEVLASYTSPQGYYTIVTTTPTGTVPYIPSATTYNVTATPLSPFVDATCGTFAVDSNGKTTSTVQTTTALVNSCWGK